MVGSIRALVLLPKSTPKTAKGYTMTTPHSEVIEKLEQLDDVEATYSPEDNKLRIYSTQRFEDDLYALAKEYGFRWAPKQELFVAPSWTPEREDFCLALAGEVGPEETSLADRAAAKAERLTGYADKSKAKSDAHYKTSDELSQAFWMGQPILVGHHSEGKARRTQEKMHNHMRASVEADKKQRRYVSQANSVESHAAYKNLPKVRRNRIKSLFVDLRKFQSDLNHHALSLSTWEQTTSDTIITELARHCHIRTGPVTHYDSYQRIIDGEITPQELRTSRIEALKRVLEKTNRYRWIEHLLNRLAYETELLGGVACFEGELTPTILQTFARAYGVDKPKATKTESGNFQIKSPVPLPLYFVGCASSNTLEMTEIDWRGLMKAVFYEVPEKKDAKPPILNFKAERFQSASIYHRNVTDSFGQIELTKEQYSKIYSDERSTRLSLCGRFRFKVCLDPNYKGPRYQAPRVAVFLTDSKTHPIPESFASVVDMEAA